MTLLHTRLLALVFLFLVSFVLISCDDGAKAPQPQIPVEQQQTINEEQAAQIAAEVREALLQELDEAEAAAKQAAKEHAEKKEREETKARIAIGHVIVMGEIHGVVQFKDGTPLAGASVWCDAEPTNSRPPEEWSDEEREAQEMFRAKHHRRVLTNELGEYVLKDIHPDIRFKVSVQKSGLAFRVARTAYAATSVSTAPARSGDTVNFDAEWMVRVQLALVNEGHREGANVEVATTGRDFRVLTTLALSTNNIVLLHPGEYRFTASNYQKSMSCDPVVVTLLPGQETLEITFQLMDNPGVVLSFEPEGGEEKRPSLQVYLFQVEYAGRPKTAWDFQRVVVTGMGMDMGTSLDLDMRKDADSRRNLRLEFPLIPGDEYEVYLPHNGTLVSLGSFIYLTQSYQRYTFQVPSPAKGHLVRIEAQRPEGSPLLIQRATADIEERSRKIEGSTDELRQGDFVHLDLDQLVSPQEFAMFRDGRGSMPDIRGKEVVITMVTPLGEMNLVTTVGAAPEYLFKYNRTANLQVRLRDTPRVYFSATLTMIIERVTSEHSRHEYHRTERMIVGPETRNGSVEFPELMDGTYRLVITRSYRSEITYLNQPLEVCNVVVELKPGETTPYTLALPEMASILLKITGVESGHDDFTLAVAVRGVPEAGKKGDSFDPTLVSSYQNLSLLGAQPSLEKEWIALKEGTYDVRVTLQRRGKDRAGWYTKVLRSDRFELKTEKQEIAIELAPLVTLKVINRDPSEFLALNLSGCFERLSKVGEFEWKAIPVGEYVAFAGSQRASGMAISLKKTSTVYFKPDSLNSLVITILNYDGVLAKAGFQTGDRLIGLGRDRFKTLEELFATIHRVRHEAGDGGEWLVFRGRKRIRIKARIEPQVDYFSDDSESANGASFFPIDH